MCLDIAIFMLELVWQSLLFLDQEKALQWTMDVETEIKELFASAFVSIVSIFITYNVLRKLTYC